MSDTSTLLCPVCGKPNPSHREVCQYCQAPLRPSAGTAPFVEEPLPPAEEPAGQPPEEELPPWLRELMEEQEETVPAAGEGEGPSLGSRLEALREDEGQRDTEGEGPFTQAWLSEEGAAEEIPDWLKEAAGEALPSESPGPFTAAPAEEEEAAWPEWLQSLSEEPAEPSPAQTEAEAEPEAPLALQEAAPAEEEPSPEPASRTALPILAQEDEDLALDEVPEWLEELPPDALTWAETETQQEAPAEGEGLTPGALPGWLEALRPMAPEVEEEAALEEEAEEVEGPLAGIQGVLPAKSPFQPAKGKVAPKSRLVVSEEQGRQVALLQETLAQEQKVAPVRPKQFWEPQRVLRMALALALLVVVWLPSLFGQLMPPLPDRFPPEMMAFYQAVEALPPEAPVLVAVDYAPGWTAEMEAAARPVLEHLLARQVRLVLISTLPTGPTLAEHLVQGVAPEAGYQEGAAYLNLGYLSGGTAALQQFALDPQGTVPWDIGGRLAWTWPPLRSFRTLGDFAALVIITDDPDVGRAWVEQVRPSLPAQIPLLMVLSTQAEPLIRPYFEGSTPQVQGMVTGLVGGLGYTRLTGRLSQGVQYWGGFSLGLWMAIGLILIGGLYNLFLGIRSRRRSHDG